MTKMNNPNTPNSPSSVSQYANFASNALANIQEMQQAAEAIHKDTSALSLWTEQKKKRQFNLSQILSHLQKQEINKQPSYFLIDVLQKDSKQLSEPTQLIERERIKKMPIVNLPDLGWAVNYLQQIQQQNFQKAKELSIHQRQTIFNLKNNLRRYSMRLSETQQKLKKQYEQVRSKKRYI